ncbi:MAG TPA: type II toxin-antitoxin system VapC family toxin [Acidobacteriaceae bacterium]|nr:type II toxin-antitoxin system VapC family toxin [Acidobacteriaceae bacterium]
MSLVLDASVTIAWLYPAESVTDATTIWRSVAMEGAWVPGLWKLEVANVLQLRRKRGQLKAEFVARSLADLETLPIEIDRETEARAWGETLELAGRHGLTVYDAAYLEIAVRRGLPLATLDGELRRAAGVEGVPVLGN